MQGHQWGKILLTGVAALNALPAVAIFSVDRACAAYGLEPVDGDLRLILRHRGVLFALLSGGLLVALFRPQLRKAALGANAVSMAAFVLLLPLDHPVGPGVLRVAALDLVGLAVLAGASVLLRERDAGALA